MEQMLPYSEGRMEGQTADFETADPRCTAELSIAAPSDPSANGPFYRQYSSSFPLKMQLIMPQGAQKSSLCISI